MNWLMKLICHYFEHRWKQVYEVYEEYECDENMTRSITSICMRCGRYEFKTIHK